MTFRDLPLSRKCEQSVAGDYRRALLRKGNAIPGGLRSGEVKAAAAGEAQFEGGKRLIAGVAQLVVRVDVNPGIGARQKLDSDFLVLDGIARPERDGAGGNPKTYWGEKHTKKQAEMRPSHQGESIVAGEIGRSKSHSWGFRGGPAPQALARLSAADAHKRGVFVIAGTLAGVDFLFGLFVGHSSIDAIEDLPFRQTGVFEARNFRAGHDRLAIQMTVKNELNGGVRETDKLESDGIDADGVELVGAGNLEDLRLGESGAGQVGGGIGTDEEMFLKVRGAHQFNAGVVANPCVF
jgi:hypothetical protein